MESITNDEAFEWFDTNIKGPRTALMGRMKERKCYRFMLPISLVVFIGAVVGVVILTLSTSDEKKVLFSEATGQPLDLFIAMDNSPIIYEDLSSIDLNKETKVIHLQHKGANTTTICLSKFVVKSGRVEKNVDFEELNKCGAISDVFSYDESLGCVRLSRFDPLLPQDLSIDITKTGCDQLSLWYNEELGEPFNFHFAFDEASEHTCDFEAVLLPQGKRISLNLQTLGWNVSMAINDTRSLADIPSEISLSNHGGDCVLSSLRLTRYGKTLRGLQLKEFSECIGMCKGFGTEVGAVFGNESHLQRANVELVYGVSRPGGICSFLTDTVTATNEATQDLCSETITCKDDFELFVGLRELIEGNEFRDLTAVFVGSSANLYFAVKEFRTLRIHGNESNLPTLSGVVWVNPDAHLELAFCTLEDLSIRNEEDFTEYNILTLRNNNFIGFTNDMNLESGTVKNYGSNTLYVEEDCFECLENELESGMFEKDGTLQLMTDLTMPEGASFHIVGSFTFLSEDYEGTITQHFSLTDSVLFDLETGSSLILDGVVLARPAAGKLVRGDGQVIFKNNLLSNLLCGAGWVLVGDESLRDHCIQVQQDEEITGSWASGLSQCQSLGGNLLALDNEALTEAIMVSCSNCTDVWTGGIIGQDGTIGWSSSYTKTPHTPVISSSATFYTPGNCIAYSTVSNSVSSYDCSLTKAFLCSRLPFESSKALSIYTSLVDKSTLYTTTNNTFFFADYTESAYFLSRFHEKADDSALYVNSVQDVFVIPFVMTVSLEITDDSETLIDLCQVQVYSGGVELDVLDRTDSCHSSADWQWQIQFPFFEAELIEMLVFQASVESTWKWQVTLDGIYLGSYEHVGKELSVPVTSISRFVVATKGSVSLADETLELRTDTDAKVLPAISFDGAQLFATKDIPRRIQLHRNEYSTDVAVYGATIYIYGGVAVGDFTVGSDYDNCPQVATSGDTSPEQTYTKAEDGDEVVFKRSLSVDFTLGGCEVLSTWTPSTEETPYKLLISSSDMNSAFSIDFNDVSFSTTVPNIILANEYFDLPIKTVLPTTITLGAYLSESTVSSISIYYYDEVVSTVLVDDLVKPEFCTTLCSRFTESNELRIGNSIDVPTMKEVTFDLFGACAVGVTTENIDGDDGCILSVKDIVSFSDIEDAVAIATGEYSVVVLSIKNENSTIYNSNGILTIYKTLNVRLVSSELLGYFSPPLGDIIIEDSAVLEVEGFGDFSYTFTMGDGAKLSLINCKMTRISAYGTSFGSSVCTFNGCEISGEFFLYFIEVAMFIRSSRFHADVNFGFRKFESITLNDLQIGSTDLRFTSLTTTLEDSGNIYIPYDIGDIVSFTGSASNAIDDVGLATCKTACDEAIKCHGFWYGLESSCYPCSFSFCYPADADGYYYKKKPVHSVVQVDACRASDSDEIIVIDSVSLDYCKAYCSYYDACNLFIHDSIDCHLYEDNSIIDCTSSSAEVLYLPSKKSFSSEVEDYVLLPPRLLKNIPDCARTDFITEVIDVMDCSLLCDVHILCEAFSYNAIDFTCLLYGANGMDACEEGWSAVTAYGSIYAYVDEVYPKSDYISLRTASDCFPPTSNGAYSVAKENECQKICDTSFNCYGYAFAPVRETSGEQNCYVYDSDQIKKVYTDCEPLSSTGFVLYVIHSTLEYSEKPVITTNCSVDATLFHANIRTRYQCQEVCEKQIGCKLVGFDSAQGFCFTNHPRVDVCARGDVTLTQYPYSQDCMESSCFEYPSLELASVKCMELGEFVCGGVVFVPTSNKYEVRAATVLTQFYGSQLTYPYSCLSEYSVLLNVYDSCLEQDGSSPLLEVIEGNFSSLVIAHARCVELEDGCDGVALEVDGTYSLRYGIGSSNSGPFIQYKKQCIADADAVTMPVPVANPLYVQRKGIAENMEFTEIRKLVSDGLYTEFSTFRESNRISVLFSLLSDDVYNVFLLELRLNGTYSDVSFVLHLDEVLVLRIGFRQGGEETVLGEIFVSVQCVIQMEIVDSAYLNIRVLHVGGTPGIRDVFTYDLSKSGITGEHTFFPVISLESGILYDVKVEGTEVYPDDTNPEGQYSVVRKSFDEVYADHEEYPFGFFESQELPRFTKIFSDKLTSQISGRYCVESGKSWALRLGPYSLQTTGLVSTASVIGYDDYAFSKSENYHSITFDPHSSYTLLIENGRVFWYHDLHLFAEGPLVDNIVLYSPEVEFAGMNLWEIDLADYVDVLCDVNVYSSRKISYETSEKILTSMGSDLACSVGNTSIYAEIDSTETEVVLYALVTGLCLRNEVIEKRTDVSSASACKVLCDFHYRCVSYIFSGILEECELSSAVSVHEDCVQIFPVKHPVNITLGNIDRDIYTQLPENFCFAYNEYSGDFIQIATGVEECRLQCFGRLSCRGFSYDTNSKICILRSKPTMLSCGSTSPQSNFIESFKSFHSAAQSVLFGSVPLAHPFPGLTIKGCKAACDIFEECNSFLHGPLDRSLSIEACVILGGEWEDLSVFQGNIKSRLGNPTLNITGDEISLGYYNLFNVYLYVNIPLETACPNTDDEITTVSGLFDIDECEALCRNHVDCGALVYFMNGDCEMYEGNRMIDFPCQQTYSNGEVFKLSYHRFGPENTERSWFNADGLCNIESLDDVTQTSNSLYECFDLCSNSFQCDSVIFDSESLQCTLYASEESEFCGTDPPPGDYYIGYFAEEFSKVDGTCFSTTAYTFNKMTAASCAALCDSYRDCTGFSFSTNYECHLHSTSSYKDCDSGMVSYEFFSREQYAHLDKTFCVPAASQLIELKDVPIEACKRLCTDVESCNAVEHDIDDMLCRMFTSTDFSSPCIGTDNNLYISYNYLVDPERSIYSFEPIEAVAIFPEGNMIKCMLNVGETVDNEDTADWIEGHSVDSIEGCEEKCIDNSGCLAYQYDGEVGHEWCTLFLAEDEDSELLPADFELPSSCCSQCVDKYFAFRVMNNPYKKAPTLSFTNGDLLFPAIEDKILAECMALCDAHPYCGAFYYSEAERTCSLYKMPLGGFATGIKTDGPYINNRAHIQTVTTLGVPEVVIDSLSGVSYDSCAALCTYLPLCNAFIHSSNYRRTESLLFTPSTLRTSNKDIPTGTLARTGAYGTEIGIVKSNVVGSATFNQQLSFRALSGNIVEGLGRFQFTSDGECFVVYGGAKIEECGDTSKLENFTIENVACTKPLDDSCSKLEFTVSLRLGFTYYFGYEDNEPEENGLLTIDWYLNSGGFYWQWASMPTILSTAGVDGRCMSISDSTNYESRGYYTLGRVQCSGTMQRWVYEFGTETLTAYKIDGITSETKMCLRIPDTSRSTGEWAHHYAHVVPCKGADPEAIEFTVNSVNQIIHKSSGLCLSFGLGFNLGELDVCDDNEPSQIWYVHEVCSLSTRERSATGMLEHFGEDLGSDLFDEEVYYQYPNPIDSSPGSIRTADGTKCWQHYDNDDTGFGMDCDDDTVKFTDARWDLEGNLQNQFSFTHPTDFQKYFMCSGNHLEENGCSVSEEQAYRLSSVEGLTEVAVNPDVTVEIATPQDILIQFWLASEEGQLARSMISKVEQLDLLIAATLAKLYSAQQAVETVNSLLATISLPVSRVESAFSSIYDLIDLLAKAMRLGEKIPKVGLIAKGIRIIFTSAATLLDNAQKALSNGYKAFETIEVPVEKIEYVINLAIGSMEGLMGPLRVVRDILVKLAGCAFLETGQPRYEEVEGLINKVLNTVSAANSALQDVSSFFTSFSSLQTKLDVNVISPVDSLLRSLGPVTSFLEAFDFLFVIFESKVCLPLVPKVEKSCIEKKCLPAVCLTVFGKDVCSPRVCTPRICLPLIKLKKACFSLSDIGDFIESIINAIKSIPGVGHFLKLLDEGIDELINALFDNIDVPLPGMNIGFDLFDEIKEELNEKAESALAVIEQIDEISFSTPFDVNPLDTLELILPDVFECDDVDCFTDAIGLEFTEGYGLKIGDVQISLQELTDPVEYLVNNILEFQALVGYLLQGFECTTEEDVEVNVREYLEIFGLEDLSPEDCTFSVPICSGGELPGLEVESTRERLEELGGNLVGLFNDARDVGRRRLNGARCSADDDFGLAFSLPDFGLRSKMAFFDKQINRIHKRFLSFLYGRFHIPIPTGHFDKIPGGTVVPTIVLGYPNVKLVLGCEEGELQVRLRLDINAAVALQLNVFANGGLVSRFYEYRCKFKKIEVMQALLLEYKELGTHRGLYALAADEVQALLTKNEEIEGDITLITTERSSAIGADLYKMLMEENIRAFLRTTAASTQNDRRRYSKRMINIVDKLTTGVSFDRVDSVIFTGTRLVEEYRELFNEADVKPVAEEAYDNEIDEKCGAGDNSFDKLKTLNTVWSSTEDFKYSDWLEDKFKRMADSKKKVFAEKASSSLSTLLNSVELYFGSYNRILSGASRAWVGYEALVDAPKLNNPTESRTRIVAGQLTVELAGYPGKEESIDLSNYPVHLWLSQLVDIAYAIYVFNTATTKHAARVIAGFELGFLGFTIHLVGEEGQEDEETRCFGWNNSVCWGFGFNFITD